MSFSLTYTGGAALISQIDDMISAARRHNEQSIWIGSAVDQAAPNEYGTRHMAARPFIRPGILLAQQSWGGNLVGLPSNLDAMAFEIRSGAVNEKFAKHAVKQIRRIITQKDIYDTGELWASIAYGFTFQEMIQKSLLQARTVRRR